MSTLDLPPSDDLVVAWPPAPATSLGLYRFIYRGLILGAETVYTTAEARGLEGFEVSPGDSELPRTDGELPGDHLLTSRIVDLSFRVYAEQVGGPEGIGAAARIFEQTFRRSRVEEHPLEWWLPGHSPKRVWCRPLSVGRPLSWSTIQVAADLAVQLKATDPRIYSPGAEDGIWQPGLVLLPYNATPQGLDYPVEYPKEWPEAVGGAGLDRVARNEGNDDAYPVLTVIKNGPGTTIRLELRNLTTEQTFVYTGPIEPGQSLVVDFPAAVPIGRPRDPVLLSNTSRYGFWALPRDPFALPSGDNVLRLLATGSTDGLVAALSWQHTSSS